MLPSFPALPNQARVKGSWPFSLSCWVIQSSCGKGYENTGLIWSVLIEGLIMTGIILLIFIVLMNYYIKCIPSSSWILCALCWTQVNFLSLFSVFKNLSKITFLENFCFSFHCLFFWAPLLYFPFLSYSLFVLILRNIKD